MVSAKKFEELALTLSDTAMSPHFDRRAFKKNKKIFASLHPETLAAMVKLTPEQQSVYLQMPGDIFAPASGAWGKTGYTVFNLKKVNTTLAKELLQLAWENTGISKKS